MARPNGNGGIQILSAGNTIGGPSPALRNIVSGNANNGITISGVNATTNVVQGNYVGTDTMAQPVLGDSFEGIVLFASNDTIGGAAPGAGNVIAAIDSASGSTPATTI